MMPNVTDLQEQIKRARRLAREVSDPADRERLEQLAEDYQRQLDEQQAASEQQAEPGAATGAPSATAAADGVVTASQPRRPLIPSSPRRQQASSLPRQTRRMWPATAE